MGKIQHLIRAAKLYRQLMAEKQARIAAEAEARSKIPVPNGLHDAHVVALIAKAASMSGRELLAAGWLWTRPELCQTLRELAAIADGKLDQLTGD